MHFQSTICSHLVKEIKWSKHSASLEKKKKVREKSTEEVPQPQATAHPRQEEEEETDKPNKPKSNKRTKSTKISSSQSEVIAMLQGLKNTIKIIAGKTYNIMPRGINRKTSKSKTNSGTTALERSVE